MGTEQCKKYLNNIIIVCISQYLEHLQKKIEQMKYINDAHVYYWNFDFFSMEVIHVWLWYDQSTKIPWYNVMM